MKKHILFSVLLLICLSILTGCACKHQWMDAACLTPKTCALCEETEGEPAGHSWVEASCEFPKTCTVCSATEGEPLSHTEAVREGSIDYITLKMERQTYCINCDQILSSEEILLDTLHDGTHFLLDSKVFWERYAAIDEDFSFMYLDVTVKEIEEETTKDTLTLECRDKYGYILNVRFHFIDLVEGDGEYTAPCCKRIVVDPAVSGVLGDPDPDGLLDLAITPEDIEYANEMREKAHTVELNGLKFRNLMIGFMTVDPSLEKDSADMDTWKILLDILDVLDGDNPGFVLNGIHYYANEDGDLVIEVAP